MMEFRVNMMMDMSGGRGRGTAVLDGVLSRRWLVEEELRGVC